MSERLFRAVRDFVSVRLPLYLRVFAIFLIFASPVVLVALYFDTLDHFNKAMHHIPSFALPTTDMPKSAYRETAAPAAKGEFQNAPVLP
jgi:hypothetical protein